MVLIVDDDQDSRQLLRAGLLEGGFEVREAATLHDAMAIFETPDGLVDAVLLDVRLPEGGGIDFLRLVKPRYPNTSFVMVTSSGEVLDGVAAMKAGALDYLLKPVEMSSLLQVTQRAVSAGQAARELAVRRA